MATQDTQSQQHGDHPLVAYSVYLKVWAILLVLTVLTVAVSYLDLKNVTILTATLIASVKGTLVLLYFMHVRFEDRIFAWMIGAILVTYAIFVGLTFVDYWFR